MIIGAKMLIQDSEYFAAEFKRASDFMVAAGLRYEMYYLLSLKKKSSQQEKRLEEIKQAPACQEPWFLEKLRKERLLEE